jgi:hypothetical protein
LPLTSGRLIERGGYFINEEDAGNAYLNALKEMGLENKYAIFG